MLKTKFLHLKCWPEFGSHLSSLGQYKWTSSPSYGESRVIQEGPTPTALYPAFPGELGHGWRWECQTSSVLFRAICLPTTERFSSQDLKGNIELDISHSSVLCLLVEQSPPSTEEALPLSNSLSYAQGAGCPSKDTDPGKVYLGQKQESTKECTSAHWAL